MSTSLVLAVAIAMMLATGASAATGPVLNLFALANTTAAPGSTIDYFLTVTDIGDQPTDGSSLTLEIKLAPGLTATAVSPSPWDCSGIPLPATTLTCFYNGVQDPTFSSGPRVTQLQITAAVDGGASGTLTSSFALSGGGAPDVSSVTPTRITASPPGFGIEAFDAQVSADAAGDPFTQAGGHPFAATTSIAFNTIANSNPYLGQLWPVEQARDLTVNLPPGFAVDPTATPARCTPAQLAFGGIDGRTLCPPGSQIGTTTVFSTNGQVFGNPIGVFNLVPPAGVPARLGFNVAGSVVTIDGGVRSNSDYGLSATVHVPEGLALAGTTLTLWGVPADPAHQPERACPNEFPPSSGGLTCTTEAPRRALLRNPTSCTPPGVGLATTLSVDSWAHPGIVEGATSISHQNPGYPSPPTAWGPPQGPTGCDLVPFSPTLSGSPELPAAGAPSAFSFDLTLPQGEDPDAIGTSDLRTAVVTLPPGLRTSASLAGGLQGCSSAQIALHSEGDAACPGASKIGSVTIDTPLLDEPLTGSVYLAAPHDNPFDSLLAIYLVARGAGVVIKLPGEIETDPKTGRITTTFDNQPQLPFSKLHLEFKGGPRAPLSVPSTCGTFTTHAELTGWSGKTVPSDSSFTVSGDGYGGPCTSNPFAPKLSAGTEGQRAGVFAPFALQLQRSDSDQEFGALRSLSLPPGLLADVGSVATRCTEDQARAAACPAASHVGEVTVGAGAGPDPFYVAGDVYLMGGFANGPFKGDPFGLAVVVHALAGPFDLGYVVVEAGIQVHDDGSISSQTEPFPSILQGIPLQLKDIRLNLDRPRFMVNPTNCDPTGVDGTVDSTEGRSASVSNRFQVGECRGMPFHPKFAASTQGKAKLGGKGASLKVKIVMRSGPNAKLGEEEANIKKVDVQLPRALPSRLSTLQKSCTAAQFNANPAGCPAESNVGTAVAHTPILRVPLVGPAYLVSHGGGAFPDLVVVLQGEGIAIHLTGTTLIKNGLTYSRFDTVPDAPISSFELNLPEGRFSALSANTKLCGKKLLMPTTITAQNGAVIRQSTRIAVTGCAKPKKSHTKSIKSHKGSSPNKKR